MSTAKTTLYARGTPGYRAPELFSDQKPQFSNRSDIWALGCILHELTTGRPVFANDYETFRFTSGALELSIDLSYGDEEFWQHHVSKLLHNLLSKKARERPTAAQVCLRTSIYSILQAIPKAHGALFNRPGYFQYDMWNGRMARCSTAATWLFSLALTYPRPEQEEMNWFLILATIAATEIKLGFETAGSRGFDDGTKLRAEEIFWNQNGNLWREIGTELTTILHKPVLSLSVFKCLQRYNPTIVQPSMEAAAATGDLFSIRSLFTLGYPINGPDGASGPMVEAAAAGQVDAIYLLASLGARVGGPKESTLPTFRTPMHRAAFSGRVEAIKSLAELHADVNAGTRQDCNARGRQRR